MLLSVLMEYSAKQRSQKKTSIYRKTTLSYPRYNKCPSTLEFNFRPLRNIDKLPEIIKLILNLMRGPSLIGLFTRFQRKDLTSMLKILIPAEFLKVFCWQTISKYRVLILMSMVQQAKDEVMTRTHRNFHGGRYDFIGPGYFAVENIMIPDVIINMTHSFIMLILTFFSFIYSGLARNQLQEQFNYLHQFSMQKDQQLHYSNNTHLNYKQNSDYKYLQKAQLDSNNQFDLRFDSIKNSLISKGLFQSGFAYWPQKKEKGYKKQSIPQTQQDLQILEKELPMIKPIISIINDNKIRFIWIGHATGLLQIGKDHILIDPIFSQRGFFAKLICPKRDRFREPACQIEYLKKVNIVLVSHDHHDHLDQKALAKIDQLYKPVFVAGLRSKDVFPKHCKMIELDWMQAEIISVQGRNYKITFVPACHWSRRGVLDFCRRLWGGFVIQTPQNQKIFYSGDTGYAEVFKEIGHKYGPFDLAILPIGAYEPRELLAAQHVNPEEAVKIHMDITSKKSVGVHWGTLPLGYELFYQPKYDLQKAKLKYQIKPADFVTLKHGQTLRID